MADILIRGIEMPTEQRIEVFIYKDGFVVYDNSDGHLLGRAIVTFLPEEYGRLIDADALMNSIGDVPYKGSVRRVLMSAPTVVPAKGGNNSG